MIWDPTHRVAGTVYEPINQSINQSWSHHYSSSHCSWSHHYSRNRDTFPVTENLACQAPLQASFSDDERILTLRGILLDEISAASSIFRLFGLTDGFCSDFTKQFKELLIMGDSGLLDVTTATRFYCHAIADWLKECQAIASDKGEGRLSAAWLEQLCRTLLWDFPSPDGRKQLSIDRCVLFAQ
jgi:hypothetical protein